MMTFDSILETAGRYYTPGAERIQRYLSERKIAQPDDSALHKALLDHFDDRDYLQSRELLDRTGADDWYFVAPGPEGFSPLETPRVDASRVSALAWVFEECDESRIFIDRHQADEEGFKLFAGPSLVAEIRRIKFQPFDVKRRHRVETALNSIRRHGETERLIARLRSIPGFKDAAFFLDTHRRQTKGPSGPMLSSAPKNWTTAMVKVFETLNKPLPTRAVAQELVARLFGAEDWQHLIAHWDDECVRQGPSAIYWGESPDPHRCLFYKSSAEAIYAFAEELRTSAGKKLTVCTFDTTYLSIGASLYVSAAELPEPGVDPGRWTPASLTCSPLDAIEFSGSPTYIAIAREFLRELDAGGNPLRVLQWNGNLVEDIQLANGRLGIVPQRALHFGAWWFRVAENSGRTYLTIENISPASAGVRKCKATIALYKATLRHDPTDDTLDIWEDYDSRRVVTVPGISADGAAALAEMISAARTVDEPEFWGRGDIRGPSFAMPPELLSLQ